MYKNFSYLEKDLELVLKFKTRELKIVFREPKMYDLLVFEEMVKEEKLFEALDFLKIKIKKTDFLSAPTEILNAILKVCYSWNKNFSNLEDARNSWDASFLPSILDLLWKRYWKTPIELLKEMTPTIFETYLAWFEFSLNLQNNEANKNYKFKEKWKISDEEIKKADEILKRLENFNF